MNAVITCANCSEQTSTTDYCNSCGAAITAPDAALSSNTSELTAPRVGEAELTDGVPGVCPNCTTVRKPGEDYCEVCGLEFKTGEMPAPPPPPRPVEAVPERGQGSWHAVVATDRPFFDGFRTEQDSDVVFPEGVAPREVVLEGGTVVIGRRRSADDESPAIDLSGPSGDPCVSRRHAMLVAQADGTWAVTDTHSTNGTWLNGAATPLPPGEPVQLHDGDRIFVGAFTVITMRYDPEART